MGEVATQFLGLLHISINLQLQVDYLLLLHRVCYMQPNLAISLSANHESTWNIHLDSYVRIPVLSLGMEYHLPDAQFRMPNSLKVPGILQYQNLPISISQICKCTAFIIEVLVDCGHHIVWRPRSDAGTETYHFMIKEEPDLARLCMDTTMCIIIIIGSSSIEGITYATS